MIRRATLLRLAALAVWLVGAAPASAEDRLCFDVAVVASIERYRPTDIWDAQRALGDDVIVMYWPWFLDIEVEKVVVGVERRSRLRVTALLHAQYIAEISRFLLLLRREPDGSYFVVGRDPYIVRDHRGRLVRPVEGPDSVGMLADWADGDLTRWLRPVSYAAHRAWWNGQERSAELTEDSGLAGWSVVRRGRLVARRAFYLSDLEEMTRLKTPCPPSSEP
jgi:hypothetical protein